MLVIIDDKTLNKKEKNIKIKKLLENININVVYIK